MVSRSAVVCIAALLCVGYGANNAEGRALHQDNSGYIDAVTKQVASNIAKHSANVNQANANQNAQAAGYLAAAANDAAISQTNGRRLLQDNSGYIDAYTDQSGSNYADGSTNVNQANVNQNAQAAGYKAAASNAAKIAQANGRKLRQTDNSGTIIADTEQSGSNEAYDSDYVNQANVNQNAQAAGYKAAASNSADIAQTNGRRLLQDNSGYIDADTYQSGSNYAEDSENVNQANVNQNAQAAGYGASASNSADIAQTNGRKLRQTDNSGTIYADTYQSGSNEAYDSDNVNQANVNQNAQAAGYKAAASNSADIAQANGRRLLQDNSGTIYADTTQTGSNYADGSTNVNQANVNQNAQAAGYKAAASNNAAIAQANDD